MKLTLYQRTMIVTRVLMRTKRFHYCISYEFRIHIPRGIPYFAELQRFYSVALTVVCVVKINAIVPIEFLKRDARRCVFVMFFFCVSEILNQGFFLWTSGKISISLFSST